MHLTFTKGSAMAGWASPLGLLREELIQRRDEGVVIPRQLLQRLAEFHPEKDQWDPGVERLYDEIMALPDDDDLAAREPNELDEIRRLRPDGPRDLGWKPSATELTDRLHGAWLGRFSGCALGKPVEGVGQAVEGGRHVGRARIKQFLKNRGDWPLRDYFTSRDVGDGIHLWGEGSMREKIAFMEADDDVHYSLVGMAVVEERGPEFTWNQIASYWLWHIPVGYICTAETQAITNYQTRISHGQGPATPAFTRRYRNPYREWIGAQIRADGWAWCCAGKPELAAEFAWRDASWTHERNGIYGEMMMAAIEAAAFVEHDPAKLVAIGLSEIPRDCRLARAVRDLMKWRKSSRDWESCMDQVDAAFATMHPVHTINNALICLMALFYGKMDTVSAPAIAVMGALDTDCNGATVGSIVGAAAGRKHFRMDLADRLHDTVKPGMIGFAQSSVRELAERTAKQWQRVEEWWQAKKGKKAGKK
jgi:ADP-ribosylglycohydrolase